MLEVLEAGADGVVELRVAGKVTRAEFERLTPRLEEAIARHGSIRLLCDLTGWTGLEPGALWEDLRFTLRHGRDIERMAVVTDRRWIERWVGLAGQLTRTETRCFEPHERAAAGAWVRERGATPPPPPAPAV